MAKTFYTSGTGNQQTTNKINDEKIPVYATKAAAQADLANLAEGQIIATKDGTADTQNLKDYVDQVNNFKYTDYDVTFVDADTIRTPGVYSVNAINSSQHLPINIYEWCVLYVTNVNNNQNVVQQVCIDWNGNKWTRSLINNTWSGWNSDYNYKNIGQVDLDTLIKPGVYAAYIADKATQHSPYAGHVIVSVANLNNDPNYTQQTLYAFYNAATVKTYKRISTYETGFTAWTCDVMHVNWTVTVPAGGLGTTVWEELSYTVSVIDYNYLENEEVMTGQLELQGRWWGVYEACKHRDGSISIKGQFDHGEGGNVAPHTFACFYNIANSTWTHSIDGELLTSFANNVLITMDADYTWNGSIHLKRLYVRNTAPTTAHYLYDALLAVNCVNRPATGIVQWNISQSYDGTSKPQIYVQQLGTGTTTRRTLTPTNNPITLQNPRIGAVDNTNQIWWCVGNDGNEVFSNNYYGENWDAANSIAVVSLEYVI